MTLGSPGKQGEPCADASARAKFAWNGFETGFIGAPKCPTGTVIVDAEISADTNNDDFKVQYWRYVTFSGQAFRQQMAGTLTNNKVNARSVKITSVCLRYR